METNELLKKRRKELGFTLAAASAVVGIQPHSIWRHENKDRSLSLESAVKYSKAYSLPIDTLVTGLR